MTNLKEVTCITKPNPSSRHEHITHLGNKSVWGILPVEEVIKRIDDKTDTFYVIDQKKNKRSDVKVVRPVGKNPYVQTHADGDLNDNLLHLNQCPVK